MSHLRNSNIGLAAAILIITTGAAFGASWRPVSSGLPVTIAGARALAFEPKSPATVYATSANGSLFKSLDAGASWTAINGVTGVYSLVLDPASSSLYANTGQGVFKSVDRGATWTGAGVGLPRAWISALVLDAAAPSTLYAVMNLNSNFLFKSTDGAQHWNPVDAKFYALPGATTPLATAVINTIVIDPKNLSSIYATVWSDQSGLFKSLDGGNTWYPFPTSLPANIMTLPVFDPSNPATLYRWYSDFDPYGPSGGVHFFKSTDDGASWTATGDGIPNDANLTSLAFDVASSSAMYANYGSEGGWGVLKSADAGQSWHKLDAGLPPYKTNSVVAVSSETSSTVYAGYVDLYAGRGRLVIRKDGGVSWSAADSGLTYIAVRALALDATNSATVYAGMGAGGEGVFKSVDGGVTWSNVARFQIGLNPPNDISPPPQGEPGIVNSLLISTANRNILYAATDRIDGSCDYTDNLFFKSLDGGANWSNVANPPDGGCGFFLRPAVMVLDPTAANDIYLGGSDDCGNAILDMSSDGGGRWRSESYGFASAVSALVIDPAQPTLIYAAAPEGVFKSVDGGVTWSKIGLSSGANALAIDPVHSNILYAAATSLYGYSGFTGLFKSTDGGVNWTPINNGLATAIDKDSQVTALVVAPHDSKIVWIATAGDGVYKSADGGATWVKFNNGLPNLDVRRMAVAAAPSNHREGHGYTLFVATPAGVFKVEDEELR